MHRSICDFGVRPNGSPEANRQCLQDGIDWATECGGSLWVAPSDTPWPVAAGLRLRANASLVGAHGPVGRGTRHPRAPRPVGSVFAITGTDQPFVTVESSTQLRGLQLWYPEQPVDDVAAIVEYPPTVQVAQDENVYGVTLSCLTFFGEFFALDFRSCGDHINEQILVEHCYGYPLSGRFVHVDRCYDIPRLLHCHVNPANRRLMEGQYSREVIDSVMGRGTYAYQIDHTDNAQCMDLFTFGTYGGARLGPATYGQLTNFNFDCVTVGLHKSGDSPFNRNWQLAQGSIIANAGPRLEDVHPLIIDGQGHTAVTNVEAFSGPNGALSTLDRSWDYAYIGGDEVLTASFFGCRMRDYTADDPLTITSASARVRAVACFDREQQVYER